MEVDIREERDLRRLSCPDALDLPCYSLYQDNNYLFTMENYSAEHIRTCLPHLAKSGDAVSLGMGFDIDDYSQWTSDYWLERRDDKLVILAGKLSYYLSAGYEEDRREVVAILPFEDWQRTVERFATKPPQDSPVNLTGGDGQ